LPRLERGFSFLEIEMLKRAYSLLEIKAVDDDKREITGLASTPSTDRLGDIVDPKGAEFTLPLPFLWQHDKFQPIGHVTKAKATKDGIEVLVKLVKTDEPGTLKDRLDEAWQSIKLGLVRGLSIGFRSLEHTFIEETSGIHFVKWDWLELSAVTIPANAEASIQTIKSIDTSQRAASGLTPRAPVALIKSPGVSGTKPAAKRGPVQLIPRKYREDNCRPDQGSGKHPCCEAGTPE
jgi:HK97 family phage prohead protease